MRGAYSKVISTITGSNALHNSKSTRIRLMILKIIFSYHVQSTIIIDNILNVSVSAFVTLYFSGLLVS